ncbi:probable RNA polymerase sigma factor Y [Lentisphaera araneosa HTCC2155]|uniref:Probable RNA polymerase sigma factor Y n=1 Tax=Lentisphaera araneosa HTCC2155 TaxID=313628 RepID=A6DNG5_9BACT|nr:sigma-70 family RNA polymerase sigma factor [Lentisphaera araneosa]EDM26913.1 probable RNA polymerase sigma factor Y [Lentisphaera araneosa HTCC2155]
MNQARNTRQTLLLKIRDQYNDAAWEEFIAFYRPYVYRVIQNLEQIKFEDREDVIQEVILIAWKKLPDFDYQPQKGRFRSWLSVITHRTANNYYHKSKKASVFKSHLEAEELEKGLPPEIEKLCQQEWEKHVSEAAWTNISDKFEVKVLQAFQKLASGEKGEQVALELGLSRNSVYVYKKRVMAALQKEIAYLDEELR